MPRQPRTQPDPTLMISRPFSEYSPLFTVARLLGNKSGPLRTVRW
jgi:hypothetical protein